MFISYWQWIVFWHAARTSKACEPFATFHFTSFFSNYFVLWDSCYPIPNTGHSRVLFHQTPADQLCGTLGASASKLLIWKRIKVIKSGRVVALKGGHVYWIKFHLFLWCTALVQPAYLFRHTSAFQEHLVTQVRKLNDFSFTTWKGLFQWYIAFYLRSQ